MSSSLSFSVPHGKFLITRSSFLSLVCGSFLSLNFLCKGAAFTVTWCHKVASASCTGSLNDFSEIPRFSLHITSVLSSATCRPPAQSVTPLSVRW